jgi:hypothetical protein
VQLSGLLDTYEPSYGARVTGAFRNLDARTLLADSALPAMRLNGTFESDVRGASLATLAGPAAVTLDRSVLAGVTLLGGGARLAFDAGRLRVDGARVEAAGVRAEASGALGLAAGVRDTLGWSVEVDSLGALRPFAAALALAPAPDSLAGRLRVAGTLRGSVTDSLAASATLDASGVTVGGTRAERLRGRAQVANLLGGAGGRGARSPPTRSTRAAPCSSGRRGWTPAFPTRATGASRWPRRARPARRWRPRPPCASTACSPRA